MFWIVLLGVLAGDLVSKNWIRTHYALGESRRILGELLRFTHWTNSGAAFGILQGATPYLALVSVGCVLLAVFIQPRMREYGAVIPVALGLISGGALGNLVDRVKYGSVTDFISLSFFSPVFNIADAAIVTGAVLLGVFFLFFGKGSVEP